MQFFALSSAILGLATSASATGVLLPLYIYPSDSSSWQPAYDAISSSSSVPWLVVVNPDSGPGSTLAPGNNDPNYISATAKMNGYGNVETVGYIRTQYGGTSISDLTTQIQAWKGWSSYSDQDIGVKGIFFDEAAHDEDYFRQATAAAKDSFGDDVITICNFGDAAAADFYDICSIVLAFEDDASNYQNQTTISNNVPSGSEKGAAIVITGYQGSDDDLASYEDTLSANGIGWSYFCSAGYDSITTEPATVGENGHDLATAPQ